DAYLGDELPRNLLRLDLEEALELAVSFDGNVDGPRPTGATAMRLLDDGEHQIDLGFGGETRALGLRQSAVIGDHGMDGVPRRIEEDSTGPNDVSRAHAMAHEEALPEIRIVLPRDR